MGLLAFRRGRSIVSAMPLEDGYGVVIGTLLEYERDDPDNYGNWYHVMVRLTTPAGVYEAAIDVDSHNSSVGVEYCVLPLKAHDMAVTAALADGYHELAMSSSSGALDYIRSPMFQANPGCMTVRYDPMIEWINRLIRRPGITWTQGDSAQAASALEPLLDDSQRVFIYGEPYSSGNGVHNVHQNQGDPAGSPWYDENGIWQDGGTIVQLANGNFVAFVNKFTSQAYETDDQGHPV